MNRLLFLVLVLGAPWWAWSQGVPELPELEPLPMTESSPVEQSPEPEISPASEPLTLPTPAVAVEPTPVLEKPVGPDGLSVTVLGDRVNLRTAPGLDSEIVGQAAYGDVLGAVSFTEEWVEVLPPASVAVWAYGPLLFEDREVRAPEMNVRSGPGTQFARLGEIQRGTPVTVLKSLGDWRRIETPDTVRLWINRSFVQVPPSVARPAPPEPTPTPVPVPTPITIVEVRTVERIVEVPVEATPIPEPQVTAPEGLDLVPLKGQGTASRRRGILRAYLLAAGNPSRFVLERENGTTLCYLVGDETMLTEAAGRTVLVSGRDFWVTGEKLPVTDVETVKAVGETAP